MKIIARNTCYIKSITEMKSKGLTFSLLLEHSRLLQINYTTRYKRNRTICARLAPKSIMMMTKTKNSYKRITIHTTR